MTWVKVRRRGEERSCEICTEKLAWAWRVIDPRWKGSGWISCGFDSVCHIGGQGQLLPRMISSSVLIDLICTEASPFSVEVHIWITHAGFAAFLRRSLSTWSPDRFKPFVPPETFGFTWPRSAGLLDGPDVSVWKYGKSQIIQGPPDILRPSFHDWK